MTPMIDVVFLLLIFFVCASIGQIRESHLPTPLAAGSVEVTDPVQTPPPLGRFWITLERTAEGMTIATLNERQFRDWSLLHDVLHDLASAAPEFPVILDIAPQVPAGDVIDIYDTCRAANFDTVQFATGSP
ncbi:MAG: ExbD/TolR family protein [Planctomycetota bacterium]